MKFLKMKCQNAYTLFSNIQKNQVQPTGTNLTVTQSNFSVYQKFFHHKNMEKFLLSLFLTSHVLLQGVFLTNIHVVNYTRKLEHKSKIYNPNQGRWKI